VKKAPPRIRRHFSVIGHSDDVVEVRHGVWNPVSHTLRDDSGSGNLFRIIGGLDGTATPAELAARYGIPASDVQAVVDRLDQLGVIETEPTSAIDHYLQGSGSVLVRGAAEPAPRLPLTLLGDPGLANAVETLLDPDLGPVRHAGPGDPAWDALTDPDQSWLSDGLRFSERLEEFRGWAEGFTVYIGSTIDPPRLTALNRVALGLSMPWLHAVLDGPFLLVGPTFVPMRTSCYECFEQRVVMNLREGAGYQRYKQALATARVVAGEDPVQPPVGSILAGHAALETLNYVTTRTSFTVNKVLAIYLPTMELVFNDVPRLPGCRACGPVAERDDQELYFDARAWLDALQPSG
jgi:bacteriocin biosynthesis cyclodehydratase domain-containing protein